MRRYEYYSQKMLGWLRIRSVTGGLEVSDQLVRLAYFDGGLWQLHAIRLEPGVLENGKIKDRPKFLIALAALKAESRVGGKNKNKRINVVMSLSSVNVYTQVFSLPALGDDALAKAAELNLQMASPSEAAKTYSGWEVVGKNEAAGKADVLSAYIDREVVDEMVQALLSVGFLVVAVEPHSLALTRILREKGLGIDEKKPYLLLGIDNVGIDFLVIRNGLPYFEYADRWKDVANESGSISIDKFKEELTVSLRQVTNFYNQHWTEPIGGVIIAAATLHEIIDSTVAGATTLPTVRLTLEMGQPISPEWLVAIGCSLRGVRSNLGGNEISLLGTEWEERLQEEHVLRLVRFWDVLMPIAFGILVAIFWMANGYLSSAKAALESTSNFNLNAAQTAQVTGLEASTTQFNDLIAMTQAAESSTSQTYEFLDAIQSLAVSDNITINHIAFPGGGAAVSLSGSAPSEDRVVAFKAALQSAPGFSSVNLPITSVQDSDGTYTFSMTFIYSN